ncbi:papain-like cysteine protease family protein [Flavobacterium saccharophilum]|uniref:Papain-like cysteine protease AvrRpt2 n=1 Tax=Flavobacterium saccharophilum TaxID=29534 RepID=A0A1M7ME58_9FLAO|nr:papain-like cysteine protease family protein [Flavobacterium saccharophilum]SHM88630.1 Papain-like cysteine protease AvrRpt2 [Flavobacterium saccharophilum]
MPNKELIFQMERQIFSNWCWAANAVSISKYYVRQAPFTQCKIVCGCLGRTDCCTHTIPRECNVTYYMDQALCFTRNFVRIVDEPLPVGLLIAEIEHGRVVCARIRWKNGDGHFVTIHGYNTVNSEVFVYVADPWGENTCIRLRDFAFNYKQAGGIWSHSYLTTGPHNIQNYTEVNDNLFSQAAQMVPFELSGQQAKLKFINYSLTPKIKSAIPHDFYVIDFAALKENKRILLKNKGIRVMEQNQEGRNVIFEYSSSKKKGDLQQIVSAGSYTDNYKRVLDKINSSLKKPNQAYHIGIVIQPELKVDAVWVQTADKKIDKFIALFTNGFLTADHEYSKRTFFKLLRENAIQKEINVDDRLGG